MSCDGGASGKLDLYLEASGLTEEQLPIEATICCQGSAAGGPAYCTCWTDVFDTDQAEPVVPADTDHLPARAERCSDCAYRKGSPELADEYEAEKLLSLPAFGRRFWCHQGETPTDPGMLRPVAYRHPILGEIPAHSDDWQAPTVGLVPYRTDGTPALVCAGWTAIRDRQQQS